MSKESWRELYEKFQTPLEKLQFLNGLSELSWDDCQDAWFESNKLMPQIAAHLSAAEKERDNLKAKLAVAVEALKFYAERMNYSVDYDTSQMGVSRRVGLYSDQEEINEATIVAGKRAREALKAINGGE